VITEKISIEVGTDKCCPMSKCLMGRRLGINEDRILFALRNETGKRSTPAHGIVYAIAVCPHMITCIKQIVIAVTLEHTRTFCPLSGDTTSQIHIVAERQVGGHGTTTYSLVVGMIEIMFTVVVGKERTVDIASQISRLVNKGTCRTFAGKYVMPSAPWRGTHIECTVPINDLWGIGNGSSLIGTAHKGR
jgi:hypothetical protein